MLGQAEHRVGTYTDTAHTQSNQATAPSRRHLYIAAVGVSLSPATALPIN